MLTVAHTAAYHWAHAGGPVNGARADVTLAYAYALVGAGDLALTYAMRSLAFFAEHPTEGEDWDRAFAHAEMAHAAAVIGDAALHGEHYGEAQRIGAAIVDPEDRAAFQSEFARIPNRIIDAP
jgi:hypothetical protein